MTIKPVVLCVAVLVLLSVATTTEASFYRPVLARVVHYHAPLPRYAYSRHVHLHEPLVKYIDHPPPHHDHVTVERLVAAPHSHAHEHVYPHYDHYWRRR